MDVQRTDFSKSKRDGQELVRNGEKREGLGSRVGGYKFVHSLRYLGQMTTNQMLESDLFALKQLIVFSCSKKLLSRIS